MPVQPPWFRILLPPLLVLVGFVGKHLLERNLSFHGCFMVSAFRIHHTTKQRRTFIPRTTLTITTPGTIRTYTDCSASSRTGSHDDDDDDDDDHVDQRSFASRWKNRQQSTKQQQQQQQHQLQEADWGFTTKAYEQQPPHAGCHFRPTHPANLKGPRKNQRFFEGWYFRVTIPPPEGAEGATRVDQGVGKEPNMTTDSPNGTNRTSTLTTAAGSSGTSFAFIFSIEDPFEGSQLSLCCHQIMGPRDEYLVQADQDHTKFWAFRKQQALGCIFQAQDAFSTITATATATNSSWEEPQHNQVSSTFVDPEEFDNLVTSGFQMFPTRLQGKLNGHDGSLGGVLDGQGISGNCSYDFVIEPIAGWGDLEQGQKSTAGWLANFAVFEPHWQVTMADARATGRITWKGTTLEFQDAPFYAEKNWGGAFPIKWYWCQCNSFDGFLSKDNSLSVTAGGGTRKIPLGQTESLGMVSVHYKGVFYEATPWLGDMEWHISPWGYWRMSGRCTGSTRPFEVQLEAVCEAPGVKLRAPTEKDGMAYFCRDSFIGHVTLSLWELEWDQNNGSYTRGKCIIHNAKSNQAAVEIGGGPWWDDWKASSVMKQPMKAMVRLPYRLAKLRNQVLARKVK